jgi:hypothetical protein
MKAKKLLLPVLAAMFMAACDPGYNEEYTIDNQSSHDLVFVWNGSWRYYPNENGRNFDGTYPVPAGTKATLPFSGDLGQTSREQICGSARYALLGDISVSQGRTVKRGQKIGTVGISSTTYAPHLHYEVLKDGKVLDPVHFLFASVDPDEYAKMLYMSVSTRQSMD